MAEVVSEVLPQIPAAMRVSIRLLARTLASPLHFVAFYEELIEVRREQPASPVQREIRKAIEANTDARIAEAERERTTRTNPVMVFVSYARDDDKLRDRLHDHLGGLRGAGRTKDWDDGEIVPGANLAEDIQKHMDAAEIVLLLITPAFLGSDFSGVDRAVKDVIAART
jgi:hypothetical protein